MANTALNENREWIRDRGAAGVRLAGIALAALVFFGGGGARAQLVPEPLSLAASPSSPSPGEQFTVLAATPTVDEATTEFRWSVDGRARPELSGPGKNSFTLTAGNVGTSIRIAVTVFRQGTSLGSSSLIVSVSDLALPWFAETYVPPWYRGKALPVVNSVVTIVAVPRIVLAGRTLRSSELVYHWSVDDEENALVGMGRNTFRIKTSDLPNTSHQVTVVVEDAARQIRKRGELFILPTVPRVTIFSSSPLGGGEFRSAPPVYIRRGGGLVDFLAEPFFFPVLSRRNLSYRWETEGTAVGGTPENPYLLTVDTAGQPLAAVSLAVSVDDRDRLIPLAASLLTLLLQ